MLRSVGMELTYRELKAALDISNSVLYSNLNVLRDVGYLSSEKITFEGKELELFAITDEGQEEWTRTRIWLCRFLQCGEYQWTEEKK